MTSLETHKEGGFRLTGRHVAIILGVFFSIMLAVNMTFMTAAIGTFTGLTDSHPYEHGVAWNREVARLNTEARLGWSTAIGAELSADGTTMQVTVEIKDRDGKPLDGLTITGSAERPVQDLPPRPLSLIGIGQGRYIAQAPVNGHGGWDLRLQAEHGGESLHFGRRVRI